MCIITRTLSGFDGELPIPKLIVITSCTLPSLQLVGIDSNTIRQVEAQPYSNARSHLDNEVAEDSRLGRTLDPKSNTVVSSVIPLLS